MQKILKKFDCGCEWEVAVENDSIVAINYEPEKAPLDCPKTWSTIASGLTKGIFQLETPLGQSAAKVCKPTNIEELSVVTSCIRPGVGDSMLDDKTLKQHYIDRKNGLEEPIPPHPSLSPVLESTLGILIYQEQAMEVSKVIAGFDGVQADSLRKAAGKKLPELMAKIKTLFIDGAKAKGAATEEEAALIFSIIEASQRYSFNKCLCPETVVEDIDGNFIALNDVKIGAQIKSVEDTYTTVVNKYDNGNQECVEITTESGKKIICTLSHKFLCEDNTVRTLDEILNFNHKIVAEEE